MPDDGSATTRTRRSSSRSRRKGHRSWAKRRHLGLITVVASAVVLVAGLAIVVTTWNSGRTSLTAIADDTTLTAAPLPTDSDSDPATGSASQSTAPPSDVTVRGTITAIAGDTWTVKATTGGLNYTVALTPATTYSKRRVPSDFKTGISVVVMGSLSNGVVTAASVR